MALDAVRTLLLGMYGGLADPFATSRPVGDVPWDWLLRPDAGQIAAERFRPLGPAEADEGVPSSWQGSGRVTVDGSDYLAEAAATLRRAWSKPMPSDVPTDTRFARWEKLHAIARKLHELDLIALDTATPATGAGQLESLAESIGELHVLVSDFNATCDPAGEDLRGLDLLGLAELQRLEGYGYPDHLIDTIHYAAIVKLMDLAFEAAVGAGLLEETTKELFLAAVVEYRDQVFALTREAVRAHLDDETALRELGPRWNRLLEGEGLHLATRPSAETGQAVGERAVFVKCGLLVTMAATLAHELDHLLQPPWRSTLEQLEEQADGSYARYLQLLAGLISRREASAYWIQRTFLQGLVRHFLARTDLPSAAQVGRVIPEHLRNLSSAAELAAEYVDTRMPSHLEFEPPPGAVVWVESAFGSSDARHDPSIRAHKAAEIRATESAGRTAIERLADRAVQRIANDVEGIRRTTFREVRGGRTIHNLADAAGGLWVCVTVGAVFGSGSAKVRTSSTGRGYVIRLDERACVRAGSVDAELVTAEVRRGMRSIMARRVAAGGGEPGAPDQTLSLGASAAAGEIRAEVFPTPGLILLSNDPEWVAKMGLFSEEQAAIANNELAELRTRLPGATSPQQLHALVEAIYQRVVGARHLLAQEEAVLDDAPPDHPRGPFSLSPDAVLTPLLEDDRFQNLYGDIPGLRPRGDDKTQGYLTLLAIHELILRRLEHTDGVAASMRSRVRLPDGDDVEVNLVALGDPLWVGSEGIADRDIGRSFTETPRAQDQWRMHDAGIGLIRELIRSSADIQADPLRRRDALASFAFAQYLLFNSPLYDRGSDASIRIFHAVMSAAIFGEPLVPPHDIDCQAQVGPAYSARGMEGFVDWLVRWYGGDHTPRRMYGETGSAQEPARSAGEQDDGDPASSGHVDNEGRASDDAKPDKPRRRSW